MNHTITLPVSGAVLTVRRQPLDVMMAVQMRAIEKHAEPVPPKIREEVSPGQFVERDDFNDPAYKTAVQQYEMAWKSTFGEMLLTVLARTCIVHDERMKAYIEEARELQATYKEIGMDVPENINDFALQYLITVSQDDMQALMMEVFGRTLPSEGQVALRAKMFSSNVQTT